MKRNFIGKGHFFILAGLVCLLLGASTSAQAVLSLRANPMPDACRVENADRGCRRWYRVGGSKVLILKGVEFVSGSAQLTEESKAILDENIAQLKGRTSSIVIVGHTDSVGDPGQNEDLSTARARSVMTYFAAHGINPARMKAIGRGEYNPIASNDTAEGRAKNRRIELHIE